jgi:hypothetical protein
MFPRQHSSDPTVLSGKHSLIRAVLRNASGDEATTNQRADDNPQRNEDDATSRRGDDNTMARR